jgi:hypothetical protein
LGGFLSLLLPASAAGVIVRDRGDNPMPVFVTATSGDGASREGRMCDYSRGYNGTQSAFADTSGQPRLRSARPAAARTDAEGAASRSLGGFL